MCFKFQLLWVLMIAFDKSTTIYSSLSSASIIAQYYNKNHQQPTDCGIRPPKRSQSVPFGKDDVHHLRYGKIIAGLYTKEGQFPWQASLELLHPSLGFLGHWCGAVLVHKYWVLSAAHCVHNDLFNLPLPPLWTVVLGDYNRAVESGYEQRIPVEKVIMHGHYENFLHDLVLMKLSVQANLMNKSNIRRICLPFVYGVDQAETDTAEAEPAIETWEHDFAEKPDKMNNFLRSVQMRSKYHNVSMPTMKQLMDLKILNRLKHINQMKRYTNTERPRLQRFNDKYLDFHTSDDESSNSEHQPHLRYVDNHKQLPYTDCTATGWGKANITGDLTEILLKTTVPLHTNKRCKEAYGSFVRIHDGHLCAGKLNGKGGTCVGDSGGPLQCRLTKNGPWILAGITSFGSGCAVQGYPDVYVRISHYMKWIQDTIAYE